MLDLWASIEKTDEVKKILNKITEKLLLELKTQQEKVIGKVTQSVELSVYCSDLEEIEKFFVSYSDSRLKL